MNAKAFSVDLAAMADTITLQRVVNFLKLLFSFYFSRLAGKSFAAGTPFAVSIEPTTSCNLRCPECVSGLRSFTRPTGMMNMEMYRKIMDELSPHLFYLILYFQGEPYLNLNFFEMVKYAGKKKIYVATSTNAHYLDDEYARLTVESGLNRIIISLDGASQESYEKYRIGGDFEKVIAGIKNLVVWKNKLKKHTPRIILQFLVFRHNEEEVPVIKSLGKELGVDDVWIKTAQVYDYENGNPLIPSNEKNSRYKRKKDGTYDLKYSSPPFGGSRYLSGGGHCWKMWHSCVITWDGRVVPCCFDKDARHQLGTLKEKYFREIWRSPEYNNFRSRILQKRREIDICKNCSEGTKVWI
ncbi:MAG: SPASM domain-containing protein [Bacteroidetes bacterium]|nr:SPASM domain-containing protein [Bacteroidota bacterium]